MSARLGPLCYSIQLLIYTTQLIYLIQYQIFRIKQHLCIPLHCASKSLRFQLTIYVVYCSGLTKVLLKFLTSGLVGVVGGGCDAMCGGGIKNRICTFHNNSKNVQIIFCKNHHKVREFYLLMFSFYFYCGSHEYWFSIFIK